MHKTIIAILLVSALTVVAQETPTTDDLTTAVSMMARIGHAAE